MGKNVDIVEGGVMMNGCYRKGTEASTKRVQCKPKTKDLLFGRKAVTATKYLFFVKLLQSRELIELTLLFYRPPREHI